MERLAARWQALDLRRRAIFAGAAGIALAAMMALGQLATSPGMALLYSGLDPATAGEVVGALDQMQVPADVRGDAIYVPSDDRDRVRLALARDGMPRQGQAGYELLDKISGFSATTDMFNAAYWRAKEGELARTILASPGVRAARVHIAAPSRRPFSRERASPTASVTVTMSGGAVGIQQATAFRYLVALAVAEMDPDQVAIIDSRAGMILAPGTETPALEADGLGADREARLKRQLEDLLEARVGRDKARVSVAIETVREAETVTEKIIEPDSRVTIHSDTEEVSDTASGTSPSVTVASNLPAGDAAGGSERQSSRTETREKVNYDYSEVRRERVRQPGAIRRLSVAVLVDGTTADDGAGGLTWQPRPAEELAALRQLVIAAVGYDQARGDVVTVESMAFQPVDLAGEAVEAGTLTRFVEQHALPIAQMLILAAVVVVLALTVVRPLIAGGPAPLPEEAIEAAARVGSADEALALPGTSSAAPTTPEATLPAQRLTDREALMRVVAENPDLSAAMLREWLETAEDEAA